MGTAMTVVSGSGASDREEERMSGEMEESGVVEESWSSGGEWSSGEWASYPLLQQVTMASEHVADPDWSEELAEEQQVVQVREEEGQVDDQVNAQVVEQTGEQQQQQDEGKVAAAAAAAGRAMAANVAWVGNDGMGTSAAGDDGAMRQIGEDAYVYDMGDGVGACEELDWSRDVGDGGWEYRGGQVSGLGRVRCGIVGGTRDGGEVLGASGVRAGGPFASVAASVAVKLDGRSEEGREEIREEKEVMVEEREEIVDEREEIGAKDKEEEDVEREAEVEREEEEVESEEVEREDEEVEREEEVESEEEDVVEQERDEEREEEEEDRERGGRRKGERERREGDGRVE
ncbi:unnamed protein product [Closterium sp. Naga37s-1]|nr:unnamed protein product [Closterium sp. Naga37s-1]